MAEEVTQNPISFGRYTLLRRIGAGGMGEVYLARDESDSKGRACVVKKVLPHLAQQRQFVGRFLDEAKVVLNLHHHNIARVYAMGEVDGHYFLAMEYVQGKTVSRFMYRMRQQKKVMPLALQLLIGERMCDGLAYAHDATDGSGAPLHLVHRDLSPANVCVSYDGEVKIIDFGAAQSTLKEEQTAPRVVIGNLTYMSPEQAKKQRVDRRADVYSAAVVLWELIAWRPLPQKGDPIERWRKAANPAWPAPSTYRSDVPPELDRVLLRALSRDPDDRYPDAAAFGADLRRLRLRLDPRADDAALAKLLRETFAKEKEQEDALLLELRRGATTEDSTSAGRPLPSNTQRIAPSNSPVIPPVALAFEHSGVDAPPSFHPDADRERDTEPGSEGGERTNTISAARVGFGISISEPSEPEPSLLREIEGASDEVPSPYRTGTWESSEGIPGWLVYAIAFLAALGLGFLGVWLFAR